MRGIRELIFSLGLGVFLTCASAQAQDAAKPIAIQVVIGADGSIQIIDVKTGKVLRTVPAQGQAKPMTPKADEARQQLEQARKELERVLQQQEKRDAQKTPAKPIDTKDDAIRKAIEYLQRQQAKEAVPLPPSGSTDVKLDLILKQLADLRKDVDGIKKRLDGKQPDNIRIWQFDPKDPRVQPKPIDKDNRPAVPQPPLVFPGARKDKLLDPAVKKELDALLKEVNEGQKQIDDLIKRLEGQGKDPAMKKVTITLPKSFDRNAQLERRIESLLKEVEDLRREIQKSKSK